MNEDRYCLTFMVWFLLGFFLLIFSLFSIFDVSASTINSFSVNNNYSNGFYDIVKYQSSDMLKIQTYGSMNTNYNISYVQHQYNFNSTINSSYYDLKINFTNSNFKASAIQDVEIVGYNSKPTNNEYNANLGNTLNLVYVKNNNTSDSTNSITIRFLNQLASSFSYFQVFVKLDYRVMNVGLSSFDLESIDSDQAIKDLQENQNTNRDLIINNITNSIDNSLNNCYENIIPHDNYINSFGEVVINGSMDGTQWLFLGNMTLEPGNYSLIANTGNSGITLVIDSLREYDTSTTNQFSLNSTVSTAVYIRVDSGTYNNVKFKPGIMTGFTNNYVNPGEKTCTSKVDDLNDNIKDVNDSINSEDNDTTSKKCGVICKLKGIFTGITELPGKIANLIKGLFVPDNFDFINDFKDVMISKLGILGQVPDMLLTFLNDILNKEYTNQCFKMPKMEFWGYSFWNEMNFCIQESFYYKIIKDYRWMTNIVPVFGVLFYSYRTYKKFFGESDTE